MNSTTGQTTPSPAPTASTPGFQPATPPPPPPPRRPVAEGYKERFLRDSLDAIPTVRNYMKSQNLPLLQGLSDLEIDAGLTLQYMSRGWFEYPPSEDSQGPATANPSSTRAGSEDYPSPSGNHEGTSQGNTPSSTASRATPATAGQGRTRVAAGHAPSVEESHIQQEGSQEDSAGSSSSKSPPKTQRKRKRKDAEEEDQGANKQQTKAASKERQS